MSHLNLTIKSNVNSVSPIFIPDLGFSIPPGGGQRLITKQSEIADIVASLDVRVLSTDSVFSPAVPESSLILNDGTNDISVTDANAFLDGIEFTRRHNFIATIDPTVDNDLEEGYDEGSQWLNKTDCTLFICKDPTSGAAVWIKLNMESGVEEGICKDFSYNDTSPVNFGILRIGDIIVESELEIIIPFNDPAATLQLTASGVGTLIAQNGNDPKEIAVYGNSENFKVTLASSLNLTISPGISTQGSGRITITVKRI